VSAQPNQEVIVMRRLGVIVAPGALPGVFGSVVTASPALIDKIIVKGDART